MRTKKNNRKKMKTYSLSCKDMGLVKCNYIAMGETQEEVMKMAGEHFMKVHPKEAKESMEKMSKEEMDHKMMQHVIEKDGEM